MAAVDLNLLQRSETESMESIGSPAGDWGATLGGVLAASFASFAHISTMEEVHSTLFVVASRCCWREFTLIVSL